MKRKSQMSTSVSKYSGSEDETRGSLKTVSQLQVVYNRTSMEQTASVLRGDFEGRQKKDNNYLFFNPLGRKFGSVIAEVGQVEVMALPLL